MTDENNLEKLLSELLENLDDLPEDYKKIILELIYGVPEQKELN